LLAVLAALDVIPNIVVAVVVVVVVVGPIRIFILPPSGNPLTTPAKKVKTNRDCFVVVSIITP
jgi:hypothetical protein